MSQDLPASSSEDTIDTDALRSNKNKCTIYTNPTIESKTKAQPNPSILPNEAQNVEANNPLTAKQISLLENTKNNIIQLIDQQLVKLQMQQIRVHTALVISAGEGGDNIEKLINATEGKKRNMRKDSLRKIREQIDIMESLED